MKSPARAGPDGLTRCGALTRKPRHCHWQRTARVPNSARSPTEARLAAAEIRDCSKICTRVLTSTAPIIRIPMLTQVSAPSHHQPLGVCTMGAWRSRHASADSRRQDPSGRPRFEVGRCRLAAASRSRPEATSDRTGPLSQVGFDTTMEDHNFAATFNRRASRSDWTDAGFYGPMGNFLFCFCAQLERAGPGPERHLGKVQLPAEPADLLKSRVAMVLPADRVTETHVCLSDSNRGEHDGPVRRWCASS